MDLHIFHFAFECLNNRIKNGTAFSCAIKKQLTEILETTENIETILPLFREPLFITT